MAGLVADELAEFALSYDPVEQVRDAVSKSVVDFVGCLLAAQSEPVSVLVRNTFAHKAGSTPIIGSDDFAEPADAALIMGTISHALDLDDFDVRAGGHPAVAIMPTVFAGAFVDDLPDVDLLAAIGAGYETMTFLGLAMHKESKAAGQHATGVFGALAAAVAAARLMRLDVASTRNAIGIAVAQASGMRANFGTMAKPFQAGNAARAGLVAAVLARQGMTSGRDAIGEPGGLIQLAMGAARREETRDRLLGLRGRLGSFLQELPPSIKRHASCGSTHASIDAAIDLRERIGLLEGIKDIEVTVPPVYLESLFYSRPVTGLEAKFSLEHCIAMALVYGDANRRRFLEGDFSHPEVMRLRELVIVTPDSELEELRDAEKCLPARLTIRTTAGEHSTEVINAIGTSRRPMEWAQVEQKFFDNSADIAEARRVELLRCLRTLGSSEDIVRAARIASGHT